MEPRDASLPVRDEGYGTREATELQTLYESDGTARRESPRA